MDPAHKPGTCAAFFSTEQNHPQLCQDDVDFHFQDFEPYIVAPRERLPPYDERLRGYFENKAVHIRHLATLGCACA